eukprot:350910-Chlamydomonas_euryale.AAC.3
MSTHPHLGPRAAAPLRAVPPASAPRFIKPIGSRRCSIVWGVKGRVSVGCGGSVARRVPAAAAAAAV